MLERKNLGGLTAVVALVAAMMAGLFFYSGTGTASADESSCTINTCDNSAPLPSGEELREALSTGENGAYFWTGRVNGTSVEADALRIARDSGGTTLEGALAEAGIVMPTFDNRSDEARRIWTLASQIFAELASGDVFVVMGDEIREGNIFQSEELPTLRNNVNVDRVIQMDNAGREVQIIFERNPAGDQPDPEPTPTLPPDDEEEDPDAFGIVAQEDGSKCVDSSDGEDNQVLRVRACNGTARQLFELDGGLLRAEFDDNLCLDAKPGVISAGGFISDVKLRDCNNASTWQFQDDGTVFSNANQGCLSVADNRLVEAAEVFTQPCNTALTWNQLTE